MNDKVNIDQEANRIIERHITYSMIAGALPLPFADIVAVTAMQISMIQELAKFYEIDFTLPTALIIGSEEKGISDEYLKLSDEYAKIPVYGSVESLNAGVAASILKILSANHYS